MTLWLQAALILHAVSKVCIDEVLILQQLQQQQECILRTCLPVLVWKAQGYADVCLCPSSGLPTRIDDMAQHARVQG